MKICIVNVTPVPHEYLKTCLNVIDACCGRVLLPDTRLEFRTPAKGPLSLPQHLEDYRNPYFEHLIAHETLQTIIAADREGFDAIVVFCFDDPGVKAARALVKTPVFGLSEATFNYACQLGTKFGALVPDMPGQVAYVRGQIDAMGLSHRLIPNGVRAESKRFTESFAEAMQKPQTMIARLKAQALEMVEEGADVIVIACGGLGQVCGTQGFFGLEYNGAIVPVVNPLTTGVKMAEVTVAMQKALGAPVYSQLHIKHLSAEDRARIHEGFAIETKPWARAS